MERYCNADNRACHFTILNVGFMEDATLKNLNKIQQHLTNKYQQKTSLFDPEEDPEIKQYVENLWHRILSSKKLDIKSAEILLCMVVMDKLVHSNVREFGAEKIAYQTWEKLDLMQLLILVDFSPEHARLSATPVVSRVVFPSSELKTLRWIKENSAVCELPGYDVNKVTKDSPYKSALDLYKAMDAIEKHISRRTNELFDLKDKIILYDLTKTYFEGEKRNSKLVKLGRSKEKRNDAKLIVIALVVKVEGFINYSSIPEGNIANSNTLSAMIDKLASDTCPGPTVVALDAVITTEENLSLIQSKG